MRRYVKVLLALFLLGLLPVLMGAGPGDRAFAPLRYALELDGVVVGWISSAEGGYPYADVVAERVNGDYLVKKHIAGVKYEDITVTMGTGMSEKFYEWIKDSFDKKYTRKNGAIIAADFRGREMSRLEFRNALITEIGFPALDASSKDAAKMTIKFKPELTRRAAGSGKTLQVPGNGAGQKKWLPANFRLRIDGLDEATARVNKIEALVVKQKVVENPIGDNRDDGPAVIAQEIPNLVITLPESHADSLVNWIEDFMVNGNNGDDMEKNATLEFLSSDLQNVLFTLDMHHLGIFRLTPDKTEAGSENIRRVKAELYCEDMRFSWGQAATR